MLFEAFGSGVLRPDFATVFLHRVLLFSGFRMALGFSVLRLCVLLFEANVKVFCCSRLSEAMFPSSDFARLSEDCCFCGFLWVT